MSKESHPPADKWAVFRFSIIGGLLADRPENGDLQRELKKLARRTWDHPTKDERVKFHRSTIERWYYKAKNADDPIKALSRKVRSDIGASKAMSAEMIAILGKQYAAYRHWSYQLHSDNLEALIKRRPELGEAPSYATVMRRMQERGWYKKKSGKRKNTEGEKKAAERLESLEVRSYEAAYVHLLWHLDFHTGGLRVVGADGEWYSPKALAILDDRSRLCCHIQWYLDETAEALIHGLSQAFHKRGLPWRLMTDNGAAMLARETENGLVRLGIKHERTLPYSPYVNGKQECFWGQLEGRLLAMLTRVKPLTLEFLNLATQAWVEMEYNKADHDEIGTSPIKRLLREADHSRPAPDSDALQLAFTLRESRTQRQSDGSIQIAGVRFEIPSRFRHMKRLHVRYASWDLSAAWIADERTGDPQARIFPQDKAKNASGQRRALEPEARNIPDDTSTESIPPLLNELLADYAATGLPPAYLPRIERSSHPSDKEQQR
jgi:transposase InsO family protein